MGPPLYACSQSALFRKQGVIDMCKWPGVLMAALGLLVWLAGDRLLMNYAPQNQAGSERIADVAYGGRVLGFADQDFKRWSVPVGFELRRLAQRIRPCI